jgi:hypothetical protein
MYSLKDNENEARERLQAFWEGSSLGRPALQVMVSKPDYEPKLWEGPEADLKKLELTPEWQVMQAVNAVEGLQWLAEAMPGYTVNIGQYLSLLALLVGGDYDHPKDENGKPMLGTAWLKLFEDVLEQPLPTFDAASEFAARVCEVIHGVGRTLEGRAIVSQPVWVDPLTTLSSLRGVEALCADLIERPAQIEQWLEAATTLEIEANEHFYQACLPYGQGECLSWLGIMAEGRMDSVQCDFSVMMSPDMYEQFYMPTLRRQTAYFDYSIYHLDGDPCMRFLDQIASSPGLNALQYTRVAGCEYPGRCLDDCVTVREKGLAVMVHCLSVEEAIEAVKHVGPDGLFIWLPPFKSQVEAEDAIDQIAVASA